MARISKLQQSRYPLLVRLIFWAQRRKYGAILEPAFYWGRAPKILYGIQVLYRCLDRPRSPLDSALRALVSNRIAQLNHCAFCFDLSASSLEKKGVPAAKILALDHYASDPSFTEKERTAIAYAEAVTGNDDEKQEQALAALKSFFNEDEIVELTGWICFQIFSSKFNAALDIPAQGFCRLPGQ
ncbi:MAG: carboxymuconolactone decarboxylase family protein [Hyphomicrobiales bacterium]|nr:carboxymuconolactone decarboxylase family protein [Hyphomicrobiales bacterium]